MRTPIALSIVGIILFGCDRLQPPVQNDPPGIPSAPSGTSSGWEGTSYSFSSSAVDPDGDDVAIKFDWGDGSVSDWSAWRSSGGTVSASHTWQTSGVYSVKAQAKDRAGEQSSWSSASVLVIVAHSADFTFVLTWGADPEDMDSHLWTPEINGTDYHVYYGNPGSESSPPYCMLDVDDTDGFGPEHITIADARSGAYTYAVHHYSGDGTVTTSDAVVKIYRAGQLARTYSVPSQSAGERWWWHVCRLDGSSGSITTIGTISSDPPYSDDAPRPAKH